MVNYQFLLQKALHFPYPQCLDFNQKYGKYK